MKIVVTGSKGFIGRNLCFFLKEQHHDVLEIHRDTKQQDIHGYLSQADFVFHLAGINRPKNPSEFKLGNVDLTQFIIDRLSASNRGSPIVLASSKQADDNSDYGISKYAAEKIVEDYSQITGAASYIYRLPNVFGKWCKPNYNSFIATFCNNIANGIGISVNDVSTPVRLAYIDDVCDSFLALLDGNVSSGFQKLRTEFNTTVGEVSNIILSFKSNRTSLVVEPVGSGLTRALYSTYLSYISPDNFNYSIPSYIDERGVFCEMLKTKDSGQFSYFTAHPGITRGGHYHHTKTEKFLVISGEAVFKFENITTGKQYELTVSGSMPEIVETVPGWAHDITNIGDKELIVMLWSNEIFDDKKPDTIAKDVF